MSAFLKESGKEASNSTMDACAMVLLKIYDQDEFTDDDMMGTLVVPIPAAPRSGLSTRQWYAVDNLFVPNAIGEVEVELRITPELQKMSPKDFLPSPDTFAKWSGCILGKQQVVNEHNVVVENNQDHKSYILQ
ncbi:MAG: hypothetical protein SGARI_008255, partial [Bacillariaceae sp.]